MKHVVIFDLDHTLYDTDRFKRDSFRILAKLGVAKKRAEDVSRDYFKERQFHHRTFARLLLDDAQKIQHFLKKHEELFLKSENYWYEGVYGFLKELRKKYYIVLLSYGDKDFQLKKISPAYTQMFDEVIVTRRKDKIAQLRRVKNKHSSSKILLIDDADRPLASARALLLSAIRIKKTKKDKKYFDRLVQRIRVLF